MSDGHQRAPRRTEARPARSKKPRHLNVHHLHDPASVQLAQMIVDYVEGARLIPYPVDNKDLSKVSVFDEESQRTVAGVEWQRGTPRDLDQAAYQLTRGAGISTADQFHRLPGPKKLHEELGVPIPTGRRRKRSGSL